MPNLYQLPSEQLMQYIRVLTLTLSVFATMALGSPLHGASPTLPHAAGVLASTLADGDTLWNEVAGFVDKFPRRLSGSQALEDGINWLLKRLRADGWQVNRQNVHVPVWVRGTEWCKLVEGGPAHAMPMAGLGGSVSTGGKPLRAPVLVVSSFADLEQKAHRAKGKIVVWNVPFSTYGATVEYRYSGASKAAAVGAVASLVRSVGPFGMQTPHTGMMEYDDAFPKIPCAAITIEDALLLQRLQDAEQVPVVELYMEARELPDAVSGNIVFEIPGTDLANEVVVMGGHIDSWDLGTGAMDDASGCFVAWRALHAIRRAGLKPRRTLRVCFWTNEENGLRGARAYAEHTRHEKHFAAMEIDGGTFNPTGFSGSVPTYMRTNILEILGLLKPVGATTWAEGGGGADTSPLAEKGVPVLELTVDTTKYFWYHHTEADTPDKLDPQELNKCTYAVAVMAYALSCMDSQQE